jgi:hypothetical protein
MTNPNKINEIFNELLKQRMESKPSKPAKQELTNAKVESLNNRLEKLTPQFKKAINEKNIYDAKIVISDLQHVLRTLSKTARLVEFKNQLYELALEEKDYDFAIDGFLSNRTLVSNTTRLHLEATALLAIAYLRKNEIEKAKPFIKEVLQNKKVIKTDSTREKFNKEIIARFDEECALASLRSNAKVEFNLDELHDEVVRLLNDSTDEQLYGIIGRTLPKFTKDLLYEVDKFSKNQLSYKEQKMLSAPEELVKDEPAGRTVFSSFKRVVYKSLCDTTSEVYKAWYTNGVGAVVDKKFITAAVALALSGQGIGAFALAISAAALVIRFGLDVYCEQYKPLTVTGFRRKSD